MFLGMQQWSFFFGMTLPFPSPDDEKGGWQAASWAGLPVTMTPSA